MTGWEATAAAQDNERIAALARATAARNALRSQQRNRMLAVALASVAVLTFITVLTLAVMYHYAEAHHEFSGF